MLLVVRFLPAEQGSQVFFWSGVGVTVSVCSLLSGSYLLSGGHECVLVKWQMNSEHKDFLPRLGSPLHSIASSPDGTLYVTSHTDNGMGSCMLKCETDSGMASCMLKCETDNGMTFVSY